MGAEGVFLAGIDAVQGNGDQALDADLFVQQLADGFQLHVAQVSVGLLMHHEIDHGIVRQVLLDQTDQGPKIIADVIVQAVDAAAGLRHGVAAHEHIGHEVRRIVDHGGVGGQAFQGVEHVVVIVG